MTDRPPEEGETAPEESAPAPSEPPAPPTSRREVVATLSLVALLVGAVVTAHYADRIMADATPEQCAALLDRYVAHRARAVQPEIGDSAIASQQRQARDRVKGWKAYADCPDRLTRSQVECAMQSNNADEFERCLQ